VLCEREDQKAYRKSAERFALQRPALNLSTTVSLFSETRNQEIAPMDATVAEPEQQQSEIIDSSSLEALNRSEITTAVDIAKRYPRSIQRFEQRALSIACGNAEVAASCWYRLKRRGKDGKDTIIEGPSVRLAEIVARRLGQHPVWRPHRRRRRPLHHRSGGRPRPGGEREHHRSRSAGGSPASTGQRYGDDMVGVTANAACSIALRNAINATVPLAYTNRILAAAKKVAIGDAKSLDQRRQAMVTAFGQMGVSVEQLCAKVAKPALADIGLGEMEELLGVFTAIKDGDSTIDDEFAAAQAKPAADATAEA
jgi:hypothetical protein